MKNVSHEKSKQFTFKMFTFDILSFDAVPIFYTFYGCQYLHGLLLLINWLIQDVNVDDKYMINFDTQILI